MRTAWTRWSQKLGTWERKWLAVRLSYGLVIGSAGCAHGGAHRGPDDATLIGGVLATAALTFGAVMLAREAGKRDSPEPMIPVPRMPNPLGEH